MTDTLAKKKHTGIAMLMLVIALALAISIYYFSTVSLVDVQLDSTLKTQAELKKAKRALLDYALVNWRTPGNGGNIGRLPCPDYGTDNNEGSQDAQCGTAYANAIGFFPWRALGIDIPRDSSGNCFLYVVSPAYKSTPIAALNPDSYGQIQIVDSTRTVVLQGVTPESRPVAVIIAPGKALSDQARVHKSDSICGENYDNIAAYLDDIGTINNAAIDTGTDNNIEVLVNRYAGSEDGDNANPLNDRLITITHQEFWHAMESTIKKDSSFTTRMTNLTEAIATCLAGYGNKNSGYLPMPAPLHLSGGEYRQSTAYEDSFTAGYAGRLPYNVSKSNSKTNVNEALSPGNVNVLFKNNYCDDIDLLALSNNINLSGDTGDDKGEYHDLWQNWKDHFFYAVSKYHNPDADEPGSSCGTNCVKMNGNNYAGIVFFAGVKESAQQRYTRPFDTALASKAIDSVNTDDKDDVVNYLNSGSEDNFPVYSGSTFVLTLPADDGFGDFTPDAAPLNGDTNDSRFCITPTMTVESC